MVVVSGVDRVSASRNSFYTWVKRMIATGRDGKRCHGEQGWGIMSAGELR
jgi:hypothetical protein